VDTITRKLRFDIPMLARRVTGTLDWIARRGDLRPLPVGLFGASTGAAAALVAAGERPGQVKAIVCRGGRPDLADDSLTSVHAPTLLIVGSEDTQVLEWNRRAMRQMPGNTQLLTVAGASHLFEEPGTLQQVARHAAAWFTLHLTRSSA
jgi:pimeloyl-ACP methyl ester carboxylesterase